MPKGFYPYLVGLSERKTIFEIPYKGFAKTRILELILVPLVKCGKSRLSYCWFFCNRIKPAWGQDLLSRSLFSGLYLFSISIFIKLSCYLSFYSFKQKNSKTNSNEFKSLLITVLKIFGDNISNRFYFRLIYVFSSAKIPRINL